MIFLGKGGEWGRSSDVEVTTAHGTEQFSNGITVRLLNDDDGINVKCFLTLIVVRAWRVIKKSRGFVDIWCCKMKCADSDDSE